MEYKFLSFRPCWSDDKVDGKSVKVGLYYGGGKREMGFAALKDVAKSLPDTMPYRKELVSILDYTNNESCWASPTVFGDSLAAMFQLLDIVGQQKKVIDDQMQELRQQYEDDLRKVAEEKETANQKDRNEYEHNMMLVQENFTKTLESLEATINKKKEMELAALETERKRLADRCGELEKLVMELQKEYDTHLQLDVINANHEDAKNKVSLLKKELGFTMDM